MKLKVFFSLNVASFRYPSEKESFSASKQKQRLVVNRKNLISRIDNNFLKLSLAASSAGSTRSLAENDALQAGFC